MFVYFVCFNLGHIWFETFLKSKTVIDWNESGTTAALDSHGAVFLQLL